jgi:hypothetical protein
MSGAWCEPRMAPATVWGNEKGSKASPTAGRPDWHRMIMTGSSLPTSRPAMSDSRWVDVTAATSPSALDRTRFTTYRAGAPMNRSKS